ncbi:MAG: LysR family transcriptional regulator [Acidobacteria bacterium]|nr:LysR family transcriptional regulator [Acidobacteriota bacterium]
MDGLGSLAIRDLEGIAVLARTLHFGKAAEQCGIAQSSLSALVRRVEVALGLTLFERTSRRCAVTPEGVFVVEAIERLLRQVSEMERGMRGTEPLRGHYRLGAIPTLGPYLIPFLLPALREAFPEASFYFFEALTEQLVGMLRADRVDAALLSFPTRGQALEEFPLFEEELLLALPHDHPLTSRTRIAHPEIPVDELILMDHGHCLRDHTLQICGHRNASSAPVHATSLETLRFMVGAGVGSAVVPALAVCPQAPVRELVVYRKFEDPVPTRTIGLVVRAEPRFLNRARPLIEVLSHLKVPNVVS